MNGKTFKFKVGKPVKVGDHVAFLPTVEAQQQHAEIFAKQARIADKRDSREIGFLETLMGLAGQGR